MTSIKRSSKKKQVHQESEPIASRPHMPGYGVPENKKGMLPWSHVTGRMAESRNYWISTVSPAGRPHATPVWGLWLYEAAGTYVLSPRWALAWKQFPKDATRWQFQAEE
jgi:hypothetical protein